MAEKKKATKILTIREESVHTVVYESRKEVNL